MRPNSTSQGPTAPQVTRLSDDHHDYDCSHCGSRDGVCMEALWLAQRIARGLAARADDLPAEFELTSETRFGGCGCDCTVRLRVNGTRLDIDCGPPPDSPGARPGTARVTALTRLRRALASGG